MYLGCDPEIFLTDSAGALVSAVGKIGGTKQAPRPLPIGDGFAVQEDNVAIEFNIPPADSQALFVHNIQECRNYLAGMVAEQGLKFINSSAEYFPIQELMTQAAQEFGCDPDFNAWTGRRNPRPKAIDETLRSAGGHVHVGYYFDHPKKVLDFTKYLDLYLAVPSVLMDAGELRKQLYGKAGAFRHKPYGMEYRVLSNYWIFDNKLISWVWSQVHNAMEAWQAGVVDMEQEGSIIISTINNNSRDQAEALISKYHLNLT